MRLNLIEEYLGVDEKHCVGRDLDFERGISEYEEERIPLPKLQDQLKSLTKEVPSLEVNTLSDVRVKLLIEELEKTRPRPNQFGVRYFTSSEVGYIISNRFPENIRYKGKGNPRQVRMELMERAVDKFPYKVKLGQSKNGKKCMRIELIEPE
ncbi:MAG: hypothetical protein PHV53_10955 [Fermentimonas sp.]|nr:hypothetical protein [Fermentimonas sp.]